MNLSARIAATIAATLNTKAGMDLRPAAARCMVRGSRVAASDPAALKGQKTTKHSKAIHTGQVGHPSILRKGRQAKTPRMSVRSIKVGAQRRSQMMTEAGQGSGSQGLEGSNGSPHSGQTRVDELASKPSSEYPHAWQAGFGDRGGVWGWPVTCGF